MLRNMSEHCPLTSQRLRERATAAWLVGMALLTMALAVTGCVNDLTTISVYTPAPSTPYYQEVMGRSKAPSSTPSAEGENAEPLGEEAQIVDAHLYASRYGIDLEEALRRLQLQDAVDGLEAALIEQEGDTFAGLWIQHEPEFRIVVAFTRDGEETIQPYIEDKPFADVVEVRTADATLEELKAAEEATYLALCDLDLDVLVGSLINVTKNRVELLVTDQAKFDAALRKADIQLLKRVVAVTVNGNQ